MCGPYWSQWSKQELESMHGIEPEDHDVDDNEMIEDESEAQDDDEEQGCSCGSYCFDCLGMSWSDFM